MSDDEGMPITDEEGTPCCPMCLVKAESAGPELDWLFGAASGIRVYREDTEDDALYLCEVHGALFEAYMKAVDTQAALVRKGMS